MATRLEQYRSRYRGLLSELCDLGFITDGTLVHRYTRCGRQSCHCSADPPELHGPYWDLTRKVDAKTVSRRLREDEAALYEEWLANTRQFDKTVAQLKALSAKAAEVQLKSL